MKEKLIYGVGINDVDILTRDKINILSYKCWHRMMERCYSAKNLIRFPTYIGCEVHIDWHRYSNFKKWYESNYIPGYCLDKDILIPGNKIYSSETCIFIPNHINTILTDRSRDRGEYPLGVSKNKNGTKYIAFVSIYGRNKNLGTYNTPEQAHEVWRIAKKKYVCECAISSYMKGEISERVRDALLILNF